MARQKITNAQLFNAVREGMNASFKNRIPYMDAKNQNEIGMYITADGFKTEFNEWLTELVNRIGLVLIHETRIRNRLGWLIYGTMEFGDAIEELMSNIVKGEDYHAGLEGNSIDPFVINNPDIKAVYHRVNSRRMYRVTIYPDRAKRAFLNEYGLQQLLEYIVSQLTQSAQLDDWLSIKNIMNDFINKDTPLPKKPSQLLTVKPVVDEQSGKDFVTAVKNLLSDMSFPRADYNQYGMMDMVNADDLVLFVRSDKANYIDVNVLSSAFNRGDLNLTGKGSEGYLNIEYVDNFGGLYPVDASGAQLYPIYNQQTGKATDTYAATEGGTESVDVANWVDPNKNVIALACQRRFFIITRQLERMESIWNPVGLYNNYIYHQWSQYGYTPFKNAVVISEDETVEG